MDEEKYVTDLEKIHKEENGVTEETLMSLTGNKGDDENE